MTARLVLASHNQHKLAELREILVPLVPGLAPEDIVSAADLALAEPAETGLTFSDNALLKARAACRAAGIVAIADDSGLSVDILGGCPGIFSARWAGGGGDKANLELLLAQLADIAPPHRGAQFVCAAALVHPDGREHVELGQVRGQLLTAPRGTGGFGYDPLFLPTGHQRTTAEMSPAEKNALSHRGRALRALATTVQAWL
ncbi:RdgB/HAM1 family non-canonical purine NTP pyrophosphatase [Buchananella hordeovulneris]|uniref:RdgB/HAM1 family non-canonical purine NTP pyrophosphatase n=1 Tax=Buchananella hordeovulneris TaxID=52770 RepID=UPI0026DAC0B6|nr:RdgB/HAM1 family non-canonical purine NTP pyrophosphatase [Buchananella hordeovulneris]MDO5080885.1 RdgB/HAM1 family non-canonical purine NTP pyrophosphatase [Buchananella hordeovulneris]